MHQIAEFVDLLEERRKDHDILWVSRRTKPLLPHKLSQESEYSPTHIVKSVLDDPQVKKVITFLASKSNVNESVIKRNALDIINEMTSKAHLPTVRWLGFVITKALKRIFLHIYVNDKFIFNLKKQMCSYQAQYVYVPSHRSYLDFVLLSYILFSYDMALPNIASGMDFYQMFIVGELLRKAGAFYMKRSFSDDVLYKEIFKAFINTIVSHTGRAIEFFIEGTRSRSQKSIVPKYGLLSIILDNLLQGNVPDIRFIPISISYERPLEESLFVYELLGVPKPKETTTGLLQSLSILQNLHAYGSVFFNIAEPISAQEFISGEQRKAKILYPDSKLSSTVVENLAYAIINSHRENTILTNFNIIALLINENIQTYPTRPYTLDTLVEDYRWCKNFLYTSLNVSVHPITNNMDAKELKEEVLKSLKIHEEILGFDSLDALKLKEKYSEINSKKPVIVKGHTLSNKTMKVAVPAISIAIYVNPTLAFLAKLGIASLSIGEHDIYAEEAFGRYKLLRMLLSTEFAMQLGNDSIIEKEWNESINILLKENCLHMSNNTIQLGKNRKLFLLLHNLIQPFVDAVYFTCVTLFNWNETILGSPTHQKVVIEIQKQVEIALFEGREIRPHPYCLSLDLFNSTLSNFLQQGILNCIDKRIYKMDKIQVEKLIVQLRQFVLLRPAGSYVDTVLLPISKVPISVQAKL